MKTSKQKNRNLLVLFIEIALTLSICLGIAYNSYQEIHKQADNYAEGVEGDYRRLTSGYMRDFNVLKMESEAKIREGLSFDEMQAWLLTRDESYRAAMGDELFDGFAFTYKGGYVHSWNYGDYSEYVPASRPWYQIAEKANGDVAVVAPYVTFLSNTDLIEDYDILRMSIVQKYNDEVSFDYDMNVHEINDLLVEQETLYDNTFATMYDKDGYILSSTNNDLYGHNINVPDKVISKEESAVFSKPQTKASNMKLQFVDGDLKMVYHHYFEDSHTICIMIPFGGVFVQKFLFVLFLALILIIIEITFYIQNKIHLNYLEKANNTKTEFLSRMSHELRTPLNALNGYSDLIEEDMQSKNPDVKKQLQNVSNIKRASHYLLRIINDILDMQNASFGKIHIKKEVISAELYMQNIVDVVQKEAAEKNISFSYKRLTQMYEYYALDGERCQQILLNVLHNAVKFTPEGGSVKITAESYNIDEHISKIIFKVSDTGIGMSKEFVENGLFQNFMQENKSIDSPYDGCGIGMYISKQLLELMGGTIDCVSEKGKGTTFTIAIEAEHIVKKKRRTRTTENADYDLSGVKVLMCEDNPMNQDIEKRVLEKMKCAVDVAEDGKIGLQMFKDSEPGTYHIILMDIRMPNMDGWEATKRIRLLERTDAKTIPIVAVSANAFDDDVKTSLESGMNEHLAKPVNAKILFDAISKYIK